MSLRSRCRSSCSSAGQFGWDVWELQDAVLTRAAGEMVRERGLCDEWILRSITVTSVTLENNCDDVTLVSAGWSWVGIENLRYRWETTAGSQFRVCILQRSIWRPNTSLRHTKLLQMLLLFPLLFPPKKEEKKREDDDIAWRRSSLSGAWVAEILM